MQDRVTPRATRATELMAAAGVRLEGSTRIQRKDWSELEGAELDARVRELSLAGQHLEAVKLLRERRGLELTEATRRIEDLTAGR